MSSAAFALLAASAVNPCVADSRDFTTNEAVAEFFASRSVAIIAAAESKDTTFLKATVDRDAKIVRQAHVYSTHVGPDGMIEFVSWFDAKSYVRRFQPYHMSVPSAAYCSEQRAEIEFIPEDRSYGFSIKFTYENGMLVSATGAGHTLREGTVDGSGDNG